MKAMDMAMGNYLGYIGPKLTFVDAYEIGQFAFSGKIDLCFSFTFPILSKIVWVVCFIFVWVVCFIYFTFVCYASSVKVSDCLISMFCLLCFLMSYIICKTGFYKSCFELLHIFCLNSLNYWMSSVWIIWIVGCLLSEQLELLDVFCLKSLNCCMSSIWVVRTRACLQSEEEIDTYMDATLPGLYHSWPTRSSEISLGVRSETWWNLL